MGKRFPSKSKHLAVTNKFLDKLAYDLQPHQERVAKRIEDGESVIAAHSLGSGKTLTALEAVKRVHKRDKEGHVVALVPAPLVNNIYKEIDKHGIDIDKKRFHVMSYEAAARNKELLKDKKISLLIMDEAHKGRNVDSNRTKMIRELSKRSDQSLMLTGTPSYNKPSDVAVLTNTIAKERVLPEDPKEFERQFTKTEVTHPSMMGRIFRGEQPRVATKVKNEKELQKTLGKYMDFHDAKDSNPQDFPSRRDQTIEVKMSHEQKLTYQYLEGELPDALRKKVRSGMPLSKKEMASLNSFSTGIRQASNTLDPYLEKDEDKEKLVTPKLQTMITRLQIHSKADPNFKGLIYSNYLDAGLRPMSRELKKRGVDHAIFDGSLTDKKRKQVIEDYNSGKTKVLLVSSSGTEGLDLKGTKLVQIMEPHFNEEKINQVIGRAIRYKSHEHLPEKDRKVYVEKYRSVFQTNADHAQKWFPGRKDLSIDEYLHNMSTGKKDVSTQVLDEANKGFKNKYLDKVASKLKLSEGIPGKRETRKGDSGTYLFGKEGTSPDEYEFEYQRAHPRG